MYSKIAHAHQVGAAHATDAASALTCTKLPILAMKSGAFVASIAKASC